MFHGILIIAIDMRTIIPDGIKQLAFDTYRLIRQNRSLGHAVTILHVGDDYSFIAQGTDDLKPDNLWVFDIGTEKTAREFFKHNPPTPVEVENAIQVVEDEVMPLHKLLVLGSDLYTTDAGIREIAQLTVYREGEQGILLARADMENVFNRLAAIISCRPASQDILSVTNSYAATLLILREVMHHLGFVSITFS